MPTDIHLSFEDFKDRRESLGDKQYDKEALQSIVDAKVKDDEMKRRVKKSAKKTTPSKVWVGNKDLTKEQQFEEITIGSTVIRARLIDPKMHEIVDPGLKRRLVAKKKKDNR